MANPEHVELLLQGSEVWNQWLKENPTITPQLEGATLSNANLRNTDLTLVNLSHSNLNGANMSGANLSNVDLSYANLRLADLSYAYLKESSLKFSDLQFSHLSHSNFMNVNFHGANLTHSHLSITNFTFCDLSNANLTGTNLKFADFNYVNMNDTNLRDTSLFATRFSSVNLSNTKGLESVKHIGPSSISIDAFLESQGNIPNEFLLGCGLTQDVIDHMRTMTMNPLEFNSCFISYCHKDEGFAHHLHTHLRRNNLRVWYAPEDMKAGRKTYDQIDQAIQMHDKLLLILSEKSMKSDWVKTEIRKAHQREQKENRQILFPIAIVPMEQIKEWDFFDSDLGKNLAGEIREYHIPDFSNWKDPASFERAFSKLLRDLKGGKNTPRAPLPKLKG